MIKRYDRGNPVMDPKKNEPKTIAFIPRGIRTKNPCRSSANVNEDPQISDAMKAAQSQYDHKEYKSEMKGHVKIISRLDITIRKERLTKEFYQTIFLFDQMLVIKYDTLSNHKRKGTTVQAITHHAAIQTIGRLPACAATTLKQESNAPPSRKSTTTSTRPK